MSYSTYFARLAGSFLLGCLAVTSVTANGAKEGPKIEWTRGPTTADLGDQLAQLKVPDRFVLAGAADTKRLMEMMGNPPSGKEVGFLAPASENETWFVIFEYRPVGFVKDDEKGRIDADAILKGIREGTEEANEGRKKRGEPTISVTGWDEPPKYDEKTHNLVWAIRGRGSDGHEVVNYDVRLLGRAGYTSVTLVTDPGTLPGLKPQLAAILDGFSYKRGKSYAEWVPGDKVAAYGLTALVAGGAGVAAAKMGLFAVLGKFFVKAWKLGLALLVGIGAGIKALFNRLFGKKEPTDSVTPE